jgi:hypothetical protein
MTHVVTLEHSTSRAHRTVQILKVWHRTAQIWWPLCGAHLVQLRGVFAGVMWEQSGVTSQWRLLASDLTRLRAHWPLSLYDAWTRDEE